MSTDPVIQIKNWDKFQHYKNRRPPWIKLHREILDNYEFHRLQDASKALLPCLWLIASEYDRGHIPLNVEMLAFRLHSDPMKVEMCLTELRIKGFVDFASTVLAACKQHAIPEVETEREKETEKKETPRAAKTAAFVLPDWVSPITWSDFEETRRRARAPMTDRARRGIVSELERLRDCGEDPESVLAQSITRGWKGVFPLHHGGDGNGRPTADEVRRHNESVLGYSYKSN